jgi:hypothetical protein
MITHSSLLSFSILDCFVDADFAGTWSTDTSKDPSSVKSWTGYQLDCFSKKCGAICNKDSMCQSDTGCSCYLFTCRNTCGLACFSDQDCGTASGCSVCSSFFCKKITKPFKPVKPISLPSPVLGKPVKPSLVNPFKPTLVNPFKPTLVKPFKPVKPTTSPDQKRCGGSCGNGCQDATDGCTACSK